MPVAVKAPTTTTLPFAATPAALEAVAAALGDRDVATLTAFRACSRATAAAVGAAAKKNWAEGDEMAPSVARIPRAARLCVIAQATHHDGDWLRVVPPTVLRSEEP
eukprot:CAMPEP_0174828654 /NCGR_PEP_ID=MMETSP1114-20130205/1468_1 /TAXON_ID=312471 /ORGANISM="Neobodo designis, Strain CCAP 1951/1" /LENGTH=105 /DNA_ID=CAMNT_0016062377 /DNA_START=57 /DNA_END=370 /DNA_ORIENTATION=+